MAVVSAAKRNKDGTFVVTIKGEDRKNYLVRAKVERWTDLNNQPVRKLSDVVGSEIMNVVVDEKLRVTLVLQ